MWGNMSHFDYIVEQLQEKGAICHDSGAIPLAELRNSDKQEHLVVYRTNGNQGYFTYDGIDVCGSRVAEEINEEIELFKKAGFPVKKISLVGYSMGGLMVRYAAGVLETQGLYDSVEPVTFTTFCSPHMGVRILGTGLGARSFNFIGSWSMARTSRQVFLQDRYARSGTPLFVHMTSPDTPYMKALARFESRTLYANIVNDRRCEFYTAAVEREDPFYKRANLVEGVYVPGYSPTLIRGDVPPVFAKSPETVEKQPTGLVSRVWTSLSAVFRLSIGVPLWFMAFLVNAGYQALASSVRTFSYIQEGRHLPDYVHDETVERTRLDELLEGGADDLVDDIYEITGVPTKLRFTPVLKLIDEQFNKLPWSKYYVHIMADKNAHSAAIVRNVDQKSFYEGKAVVRHWVEDVLKL